MNDSTKAAQLMALYISVGMRVLNSRAVLLIAMLLTFSLFVWTMYAPTWERIAAATIFAVLIFLPATRVDAAQSSDRAVISPKDDE